MNGAPPPRASATRPVVLVDLLGTLLDEQSDYEALDAVMEETRRRFGLGEDVGALSGDFSLALMEILQAEDGEDVDEAPATFVPFEQAAKAVFRAMLDVRGASVSDADVAWFWETYLEIQARTFRTYPDAIPALKRLRAKGHRVVAVTDADPYLVEHILPATGLAPLLDGCVTAAEAGYTKPHPAPFRLALARADATPLDAIMVGDSYERDLLGARAAGVRGILVDRHRVRTVRDVPVVATLDDLPRALSQLVPSLS